MLKNQASTAANPITLPKEPKMGKIHYRICEIEFLLIVAPVILWEFCTFPIAFAFALEIPTLFFLWLGGALGTYALFKLFLEIQLIFKMENDNPRPSKIIWTCIFGGCAANIAPSAIMFQEIIRDAATRPSIALFSLLSLAPTFVVIHWFCIVLRTPIKIFNSEQSS